MPTEQEGRPVMGKPRERAVYELSDREFARWKDGKRVQATTAGSGCWMALVLIPFVLIGRALGLRRK